MSAPSATVASLAVIVPGPFCDGFWFRTSTLHEIQMSPNSVTSPFYGTNQIRLLPHRGKRRSDCSGSGLDLAVGIDREFRAEPVDVA